MELSPDNSLEDEEVEFEETDSQVRLAFEQLSLFEPDLLGESEAEASVSSHSSPPQPLLSTLNPSSGPPPSTTMSTSNPATQATSTSTTTPFSPRTGGCIQVGSEWVQFSCGMQDVNRKARPAAALAFRPKTDLRSLMRVEESSCKPLDEAKRIDEGTSTVTFSHWLNDVQRHFGNTGLDSIAFVLKSTNPSVPIPAYSATTASLQALKAATTEYDLFKDWGSISKEDMISFDTWIKLNGDEVDQSNNQYARQFLRGSVGPILRDRIDRELEIDVSGSRLFYFIIRKLQAVSATSGRQLVEELQSVKLSSIPGSHVTDCAEKIHNICTKINGLGTAHTPPDLSLLVVRCFDTTGISTFDLEVTKIESQLDDDPLSLGWKDILDKLTHKFDTLRLTKRWPPLDVEAKAKADSGFTVQFEEVKKSINDVKSQIGSLKKKATTSPGASSSNNGRDLSSVQCHYCKEKGHYKSDCPALKKKKEQNSTSTGTTEGGSKPKSWKRQAPKEGDSDTRTVTEEGAQVKYKWCAKCRRWTTGAKMHATLEHKVRPSGSSPPPTQISGHALTPIPRETVSFGLFSGIVDGAQDEGGEEGEDTACFMSYLQDLYDLHTFDGTSTCTTWYPQTFDPSFNSTPKPATGDAEFDGHFDSAATDAESVPTASKDVTKQVQELFDPNGKAGRN